MIVVFLHQAKIPGGLMHKLGRFDYAGSILFTASMTAFLFGLTTGGVMYEWQSFRVLLPLLLGAAGLVVFGWYEFNVAAEPIVNKRIFRNWSIVCQYILTVFHGAIVWSLLYFLVLYYEAVKFYSPVTSAVAILPETLTVSPAGMVVGIVAGMTLRYRWAIWSGWFLTTLGLGILLLLEPETSVVKWVFLNLPVGVGTGFLFPAGGLSIQAACEPALNGQATAFYSFMRGLGQSIGVAISGVIFQNQFKRKLEGIPEFASLADAYSRDATSVVGVIVEMPDGADKTTLVKAYSDSLHMIWIVLLAIAAVSFLMSLTIKGHSLEQEHITEQGFVDRSKPQADVEAAKPKEQTP
jgi:hypothetical protein